MSWTHLVDDVSLSVDWRENELISRVFTRTVSENFRVNVSLDKSKLNCVRIGKMLSFVNSLALTVDSNGGISLTGLSFISLIAKLEILMKVFISDVATLSNLLISLRSLRPRYIMTIVESFSVAVLFCNVRWLP